MPLYEYRCASCHHRFEALVTASAKPACVRCGAKRLEKLVSSFAVAGGGGRESEPVAGGGGCGTCGDPRGPGSCSLGDD